VNHSDQLWGPSSLLFDEYQDSFLGKQPGREVGHWPPSNARVKKVELQPCYAFILQTGKTSPFNFIRRNVTLHNAWTV